VLFSENPFVFQGRWAERVKDRYILYDGFLTNCRLPRPVWTLNGPKFDIIPDRRALVHKSTFRVRKIPLLYVPLFYKPLVDKPRKSGFLSPNAGNTSRRGYMAGLGYYWAINRSYDLMYRTQYFTQRGFAHHVDLRGKPTQRSDFYFVLYGVNDRGIDLGGGNRLRAGGYVLTGTAEADLGKGFQAKADVNYLSSFLFRQEFTESFNEAESGSAGCPRQSFVCAIGRFRAACCRCGCRLGEASACSEETSRCLRPESSSSAWMWRRG